MQSAIPAPWKIKANAHPINESNTTEGIAGIFITATTIISKIGIRRIGLIYA